MTDRKARKERAEKKMDYYVNLLTLFLAKVPFVVFCRIMLNPFDSLVTLEQYLPNSFKKEITGRQDLFRRAFYELRDMILDGNRSLAEAQDILKKTVDKYMSDISGGAKAGGVH